MQNAAAKLVLGMKKHDSVTAALTTLHWLPIRARTDFKILTLVHKCLSGNAPSYLTDLLVTLGANREGLRSNNRVKCLLIPRTYCDLLLIGHSVCTDLKDGTNYIMNLEQPRT